MLYIVKKTISTFFERNYLNILIFVCHYLHVYIEDNDKMIHHKIQQFNLVPYQSFFFATDIIGFNLPINSFSLGEN